MPQCLSYVACDSVKPTASTTDAQNIGNWPTLCKRKKSSPDQKLFKNPDQCCLYLHPRCTGVVVFLCLFFIYNFAIDKLFLQMSIQAPVPFLCPQECARFCCCLFVYLFVFAVFLLF